MLEHGRRHRELEAEPDDDARWWLTAAGALAFVGRIDPGTGQGTLAAYSEELGLWVRIR